LLHRNNASAFENAGQMRFIFGSERPRQQSPDGQGRSAYKHRHGRGEKRRAAANEDGHHILRIVFSD
jgi:hypothetical protein